MGDLELVINQVNDNYQTKHPRMRDYRNEVWDMFGNYFTEHKIRVIHGIENMPAYYFPVAAGKFKIPTFSQKDYKVADVNTPSIPNNGKYWKVFEDDMKIKIFLEFSSEFVNTRIENKNDNFENFQR